MDNCSNIKEPDIPIGVGIPYCNALKVTRQQVQGTTDLQSGHVRNCQLWDQTPKLGQSKRYFGTNAQLIFHVKEEFNVLKLKPMAIFLCKGDIVHFYV